MAHADAFLAHYLELALLRAGAAVLGPVHGADGIADLIAREPVAACVVGASLASSVRVTTAPAPHPPVLFVLGETGGSRQDGDAAVQLAPPFAAHQIVDALARSWAAASVELPSARHG